MLSFLVNQILFSLLKQAEEYDVEEVKLNGTEIVSIEFDKQIDVHRLMRAKVLLIFRCVSYITLPFIIKLQENVQSRERMLAAKRRRIQKPAERPASTIVRVEGVTTPQSLRDESNER